jgi:hypothetical protein
MSFYHLGVMLNRCGNFGLAGGEVVELVGHFVNLEQIDKVEGGNLLGLYLKKI